MKSERVFDLVVWVLIAITGLVAAYVCFGILSSEASGKLKDYSVGGAIAGALVSWSVLTTVYLQLRGSSDEVHELRKRNRELENKLIRGAPRPKDFDTEVDERRRIVLARPSVWEPRGGVIFDFELSDKSMSEDDTFAATFRCYFVPIRDSDMPKNAYYEDVLQKVENNSQYIRSYTNETIQIGGDQSPIECLKVIAHMYCQTVINRAPSGHVERHWSFVRRADMVPMIKEVMPTKIKTGQVGRLVVTGYSIHDGATVLIDGKPRSTEVVNDCKAFVTLEEDDVATEQLLGISIRNRYGEDASDSCRVDVSNEGEEPKPIEPAGDEANDSVDSRTTPTSDADRRVVFQEIMHMRVVCYHELLERIYVLEFCDNVEDFNSSSAVFNQVLASTRFLD